MNIIDFLAEDNKLIIYRPSLVKITGSVNSAILLSQIIFYAKNSDNHFFKFAKPCNHRLYKQGDSWCEILEFNTYEYKTALKLLKEKEFIKTKTTIDRITFFSVDFDKINTAYEKIKINFTKSKNSTLRKVENELYEKSKMNHIKNSNSTFVTITENYTENYTENLAHEQNSQEFKNSDLNNLDCKENFNFNSENENLDLNQNENSLIDEQKQPLKAKTEPKEYKDTTEQEKTLKTHGNAKFEKPSLDEIKKYAYIAGLKVDCERFFDYYESNGWLVGNKAKMRDWKASLRNWARNENKFGNNQNANQNANKSLTQRLNEQEARILAKYEAQDNLIDCEILRG